MSDGHREATVAHTVGDRIPELVQTISAVQMFAFSAATANPHRIHYDRRWAVDVEGHPDVVVQGPLQAALVARALTDFAGPHGRLVDLRYRNVGTCYAGATLGVRGTITAASSDGKRCEIGVAVQDSDDRELLIGTAVLAWDAS